MKTILVITFLSFISTSSFSQVQTSTFEIIITNYYFGRVSAITSVNSDSLIVKINSFNGKNSTKSSRTLTAPEKEKLNVFLAELNLNKLKPEYRTPTEDGTVIDFFIEINGIYKKIHVANFYQEELGELVKIIVELLPEDHILYYNYE